MACTRLNLLWCRESSVRACNEGQVGDVDLHEIRTGKTKATPTQTPPLKEKQQWHHSRSPQRTCLSRRIETCQPNSCQGKQSPVEGQLYIMLIWAVLRRETIWKLYGLIPTSIVLCSKVANEPAGQCKVIISLKSDRLPAGNGCMLLAFWTQSRPCLRLLMMHFRSS